MYRFKYTYMYMQVGLYESYVIVFFVDNMCVLISFCDL